MKNKIDYEVNFNGIEFLELPNTTQYRSGLEWGYKKGKRTMYKYLILLFSLGFITGLLLGVLT